MAPHDLTIDPIPDGPWDLIHARLVLAWLPEPRDILRRLAAALAPDGALAIEEWDIYRTGQVLAAPEPEAATLFYAYYTIVEQILAADGLDHETILKANTTGRGRAGRKP